MRARPWWNEFKEGLDKVKSSNVNFIWTQVKKKSIMEMFRCKLQDGDRRPERDTAAQGRVFPRRLAEEGIPRESETKNPEKETPHVSQLYNKLDDNYHLANKKALFINLKNYYEALGQDPFLSLPVTFHVKRGINDPEFARFKAYYDAAESAANDPEGEKGGSKNIWIIKPGENTNCGKDITVAKEFEEIKELVTEATQTARHTCIVQRYVHNPLLIKKRKFDIRTYAMLTSINGNLKGYMYEEGYLRTSVTPYSLKNLSNRFVHLTNDAIQKTSD